MQALYTIKQLKTQTIVHQRKFKNFVNLKYKPKAEIKAKTIKEIKNTENFEKKSKPFQETERNDQFGKQY